MTTCSVPSWLVLLDAARVGQYAKTPSEEMSLLVCTYSVFICHSLFGYQVNMHAGDVMHQWFLLRQLSAQQLALHYKIYSIAPPPPPPFTQEEPTSLPTPSATAEDERGVGGAVQLRWSFSRAEGNTLNGYR